MNPLRSVAFKLSVLTSFFVLSVIGLMARRIFSAAEDRLIGEMTVRAEFFGRSTKEALFPKLDAFSLHFHVEEMLKEKAVTYAAVLDPAGKVLSHSTPSLIGETPEDRLAVRAREASETLLQRSGDVYDLSVPVLVGARRVGTVRLGFDRSSVQEALREQKRHLALVAAVAVGFAILGTSLIVGWLIAPLPKLAAAVREAGKGNFGVRVDTRSRDEIGVLARSFNEMAVANQLLFATIKEEKAKLETIFNGTREGIVLTNPKGGMLLVNAAARALLGWKGELMEPLSDALKDGKHEGKPELAEILAGRARLVPFELTRKEPKLLILSGLVDRLGEAADPSGYLFIFHDATLEKRGETLARGFLSLVSHKLRTPLAVALGYLEILDGDKDVAPFHKKAIAKTRSEAEKLRSLVEKLITFATVQNPGAIVLDKADTSLAAAVEAARKHLDSRIAAAELAWDEASPAAQKKIKADALMLRDSVGNLMENAVKFGAKKIALLAEERDGGVRLTVKDDGPGIASEEQPKLFRKFYQIDDDFTGQIHGFGLGLAFVKNAVEAHGGSVGMSSTPGKGSEFWFEIPAG